MRVEVTSNRTDVPVTPGSPALLVEQNRDFAVAVMLLDSSGAPTVISNKATVVTLSRTPGGPSVGQVTVPGGQSSGTGSARIAAAANDVRLHADAKVPNGAKATTPLTGVSNEFDVLGKIVLVPAGGLPAQDVLVSAGGPGVACEATPAVPTCIDLFLPNGIASDAFFATGACDAPAGCAPGSDLLLVLARFGAGHSDSNPATMVLKCDKTLCPGGSIQNFVPKVSLDGDGALGSAPACAQKGVQSGPDGFCVDYVQSKRDGSGDTYLYVLLARDMRGSCC
jgi:hypothetical protein